MCSKSVVRAFDPIPVKVWDYSAQKKAALVSQRGRKKARPAKRISEP
jgi:hypothetical protein